MPCSVTAENLGVKGDDDSWRIRHIDLAIASGSFVGLIGESGAGKSTLLRALSIHLLKSGDEGALYLEHGAGRSHIDSETQDTYLEHLAYVPQEDHFAENLTVAETLRQGCIFAGKPDQSTSLAQKVGLPPDCLKKSVSVLLSGGQKRRLSIARSLAKHPDILFLDEPTSGLDLPLAQEIMSMLAELSASAGISIICTSHLPGTLKHCDRILVMSPGVNGSGGRITGDYQRLAFLDALDSDPDATSLYQDRSSPAPAPAPTGSGAPISEVPMPVPSANPSFPNHFRAIFRRSVQSWGRDRSNLALFLLQPIILAGIIVLTQALHQEFAGEFIDFFLTVAAIWIGISLCIKDFVSERKLYALDELSGLSPPAYFWSKLAFAAVLALGGVFILCTASHFFVVAADALTDLQHARSGRFTIWHFMPRLMILGVAALSGTMIGLLLSLISTTERAAISFMPLALLPQVVFSAYACGYATKTDHEHAFPFHALLQKSEASAGFLEWTNYLASLLMTTRHANWSLESLTADGFVWSKFFWPDFGALWLVFAFLFGLVCLAFFATANRAILRVR